MASLLTLRKVLGAAPWALAGAVVLAHTVTLALAQTQAKVYSACYVPSVGAVYLIKETNLPTNCLSGTHVEFSWNQTGPAGAAGATGAQGPAGVQGPAGPAGAAPAGGVVFFNLTACPTGWTEFTPAAGRTVVGRPTGGSVGGTVGTPLTNLEDRAHAHSVTVNPFAVTSGASGAHNHIWSRFAGGASVDWFSYNSAGTEGLLVNWTNGVATTGSGEYPLEVSPANSRTNYTDIELAHTHSVDVAATTVTSAATNHQTPYAQLLACQKS